MGCSLTLPKYHANSRDLVIRFPAFSLSFPEALTFFPEFTNKNNMFLKHHPGRRHTYLLQTVITMEQVW